MRVREWGEAALIFGIVFLVMARLVFHARLERG